MKKKKLIILGSISLVLLLVVGFSYAYWSLVFTQTEKNVVTSDCFEIEFIEGENIFLNNAYPISDDEGLKTTPYTFQIQNTCNIKASYQINLEEIEIEGKRLSNEYIKFSFNERRGALLREYESVEPTLENADISHKISMGVLKAKEKKSYNVRLWMDEKTPPINSVMNASFQSKITIEAVANENIPEVNIRLREELNEIEINIERANENEEELKYYYQINEEEEIESDERSYRFSDLKDGKYQIRVRVETKSGMIIEEQEMEVSIAYEKVYVSSSGNDENGNGSIENPFLTIQSAYNKVKSGGEIILLSDITANEPTKMNIENKEVTLRSNKEERYSIFRGDHLNTFLLRIENSTLNTSNINFDGRNVEAESALLDANDANLNLNAGTIIQNGVNVGGYGGGLNAINQSEVHLNGAEILNNQVNSSTYSQGGGIRIADGILNIYSGHIINNSCSVSANVGSGGGIFSWNSQMNIDSVVLQNNRCKYGGGINFDGNSVNINFVINGGEIMKNSAYDACGGISINRSTTTIQSVLYIKGGNISNNTAPNNSDIGFHNGAQIIDQR